MLWLRRQNLTNASWTTSSASAADCTHCRAKSSNPGATSEKQLFQSSWLATWSMTFSRSLYSRRCQVRILSISANKMVGRAHRAPGARALPGSPFRNPTQDQIAQPIQMRDPLAIGVEGFDGRIDAQVAVRAIGVLPAFVPVNRCFNPRIARAEKFQALFDPLRFPYSAAFGRMRKFA